MQALSALLIFALLVFFSLAILAVFTRWLFRIDHIVDLLKQIRDNTSKPKPKAVNPPRKPARAPTGTCESCKKTFDLTELTKLEIGKTVCPACKKFIKS